MAPLLDLAAGRRVSIVTGSDGGVTLEATERLLRDANAPLGPPGEHWA
jgi:hypothetical protein